MTVGIGDVKWDDRSEVLADRASCYFLRIPNSYQYQYPIGKAWRTQGKDWVGEGGSNER